MRRLKALQSEGEEKEWTCNVPGSVQDSAEQWISGGNSLCGQNPALGSGEFLCQCGAEVQDQGVSMGEFPDFSPWFLCLHVPLSFSPSRYTMHSE